MLELTYFGEESRYKIDFDIVSHNIVKIIGDLPENTTGFIISRENENDNWDYSEYTTVYSKEPGFILFSNDGSTKPLPTVTFSTLEGVLEGEKEQHVAKFEDLVVPEVKLEEGFSFIKWEPEIPSEGDIKEDMVFHAIVQDKNIYFHCSRGGTLEGETRQFVDDYSKLVVPTTTPDNNFKFVGWEPEIPKEGIVTETNFYAVFESNIPDRLETVETEITDTQLGLVENYDFALATYEEVTDTQLGLVENYDFALATYEEVTDLQQALVEVYELLIGGEN